MNFLAHSYLSFNNPEVLVGNMISDFVKGKKKFNYPYIVQKGIQLHRSIDTFTDDHHATKTAKLYLKPAVGLYSGAFMDVAYDHFLANDENEFSAYTLQEFALKTYAVLKQYENVLPGPFRQVLPYMESNNWLYNYSTLWGTKKSFEGVVRRANYLNSSEEVFDLFQTHYYELQKCYNTFFPDVKAFAFSQFEELLK